MKKGIVSVGVAGLVLFGAINSNATLTTIGTATYGGSDYNLIWDNDNNGNSVVWLDYSNQANWSAQNTWAAGLDGALTYNIDSVFSVNWTDDEWRLGSTVDGVYQYGFDGTTTGGFNITTSEMGHLFYEELGNLGYYDTSGIAQAGYGLQNTGDFDNLKASGYWSGTEYTAGSADAWSFRMVDGDQYFGAQENSGYGLALRSGEVSTDPVPEPATMLLFGIGLTILVGMKLSGEKSEIGTPANS